jgi:hypothetical protein
LHAVYRGDTGLHIAAASYHRSIAELLVAGGARPTDTDAKGKTVTAAAASDWIRGLLTNT